MEEEREEEKMEGRLGKTEGRVHWVHLAFLFQAIKLIELLRERERKGGWKRERKGGWKSERKGVRGRGIENRTVRSKITCGSSIMFDS